MDPDLHVWQSIGGTPLSAAAPTGVSVRYDADFERLEAQIQKLDSLAGDQVDWKTVVTLGREILERRSKDLLVACYLALALFHTDGYRGLARGLACIENLLDAFWPALYPELKRLRARMNALTWLSERAGTEVGRRAPDAGDADSVTVCDETIARVGSALARLAGADAVGLGELRRALKERVGQLATVAAAAGVQAASAPVEVPVAAASQATPAMTPAQAAPAVRVEQRAPSAPAPVLTTTPGGMETREECQRVIRDARASLRRAMTFLRKQAPSEPAAYRLIRALTWFDVDALPPNDAGRTRIPSPAPHLRDRFQALVSQSAWADLLNESETRFPEYPFWFDLQRFSANALDGLGSQYSRVLDAVAAEISTLLTRLPDLTGLQFADGVPFADEATLSWFAKKVMPAPQPASPPSAAPIDRGDALNDLRAESRRLAADHHVDAALALLQAAARRAPDERTRFLIEFELACACFDLGQTRAALACFDVLDQRMSRFSLDSWDPSLAAEVLQAHWRALNDAQRIAKDADLTRRTDAIYTRLCALDMVAGVRVGQARDGRPAGPPRT